MRARAALSTPCSANHAVIILACASTFTVSDGARCNPWSLSKFPVFGGALSISSHLLSLFHCSMGCRVRNIKSIPDRVRRHGAKLFAVGHRQGLQATLSREKYVGGKQSLAGGVGFPRARPIGGFVAEETVGPQPPNILQIGVPLTTAEAVAPTKSGSVSQTAPGRPRSEHDADGPW